MEYTLHRDGKFKSEDIAGEKRIHIKFNNISLSEFERRVIVENKCDSFLDMRCISDKNSLEIFYSDDGFRVLGDVVKENVKEPSDLLMIINAILRAVRDCGNYLITPEEICLSEECIYYSEESRRAGFLYIPGYKSDLEIREQIVEIVDRAVEKSERMALMMKTISRYKMKIYEDEYGIDDLMRITEDFIRAESALKIPEIVYVDKPEDKQQFSVMDGNAEYNSGNGAAGFNVDKIKKRFWKIINEFVS